MKGLKGEDLLKLSPYLDGVVAVDMKILKRKGREIKEVVLEYNDGRRFITDINVPNFQLVEDTKLRSIERSVSRGKYGKWNYPGNCGYALPKKFINYVQHKIGKKEIVLVDGMEGSGTIRELCNDMEGIKYWGNDLRYGFNYLKDEIPVFPDAIWKHPAYFVGKNKYGKLSRMPRYSGVAWEGEKNEHDGSHIHDYGKYIKWLNQVQATSYKNLRKGGYLGMLIGCSRVDGVLYDPYKDMDIYGDLEAVICKEQFNTMSDSINYSTQDFIPIIHEWLLIIRKKDNFIIPVKVTKKFEVNIMNSEKATWKELIANALEHLGGIATLKQLYNFFKDHPKSKNNNNYDAKIRQIVQKFKEIFERVDEGVYALRENNEIQMNLAAI